MLGKFFMFLITGYLQIPLDHFEPSPTTLDLQTSTHLGAIFDEHLTMEAHVNSVCRSSFFHQHNISSIRRVLDMKTTVIIVQALVISQLDYCNSLLCGLPTILIKRLQRVQNAAARVIAKAGRRDHISPILFKLHWLPVEFRIKYKILLLKGLAQAKIIKKSVILFRVVNMTI